MIREVAGMFVNVGATNGANEIQAWRRTWAERARSVPYSAVASGAHAALAASAAEAALVTAIDAVLEATSATCAAQVVAHAAEAAVQGAAAAGEDGANARINLYRAMRDEFLRLLARAPMLRIRRRPLHEYIRGLCRAFLNKVS